MEKHEIKLDPAKFQNTLMTLMKARGINQNRLAQELGSPRSTVSRYFITDRIPDTTYLYRMSKFFGVTIDFLLGISDEKKSSMDPDAYKVAELYTLATDSDKAVVKTLLSKYEGLGE